jgi:hypothetical protein
VLSLTSPEYPLETAAWSRAYARNAALRRYAAFNEEEAGDLELEGELSANLSYGLDFPLGAGGLTGAGSEGVQEGFAYDLAQRILLTGRVSENVYVEIDYDSERAQDPLAGERNIYSVSYLGERERFLEEVTVGNKELAITDSRYFPIDQGSPDSFALRARGGKGGFFTEALLRYSVGLQGRKEFRGAKRSVAMEVLDVAYVRRRFFLLPDTGIDESSLELYRSTGEAADVTVDGRGFELLDRGPDYRLDNTGGRVYLSHALERDQELIVYYEKGGVPVGDSSLGRDAIIDDTGSRDDFNAAAYGGYFSDTPGDRYLYLLKSAFNSYWEMMNAYYLEEYAGSALYGVDIRLLYTDNMGVNTGYGGLLDRYVVDLDRGAIFFRFTDAGELFYPRPFPGTEPYPATNPFDPANPVYGGVGEKKPEDSVNTLQISYSFVSDTYFLDFNLIPGSVQVTVDGRVIGPELYSVDHDLGFVYFEPGVVGPASSVVVDYRYTGLGGGQQSLMGAVGVGYETGVLSLYNLTGYRTGLGGQEAPDAGDEPSGALVNATELDLSLGDRERIGAWGRLKGGFAVSRYNPNVRGLAVAADMESGKQLLELSMHDDRWIPATDSSLLPVPPHSVGLTDRGSLLYRNYWKDAVTGDTLQALSWDLPPDHLFDYGEKAGPYNTADKPTGGGDRSLVFDYAFSSGASDPYVTAVLPLETRDLSAYQRLNLLLSARDVTGPGVRVYVELLQEYDEDLNGNGLLDGEQSINDRGFAITPAGGEQTVIGTDRKGNPNGRIDSEDLDGNGVLDAPDPETGVVIGDGSSHVAEIIGDAGWRLASVDILDLVDSDPAVFQYARTLRVTVAASGAPASGKLLFNRVWFSGSQVRNNHPEYLNLSEVSVHEDPEVEQNAFSKSFPALYGELHGSDQYRGRNDLVEKVLQVRFDSISDPLPDGSRATMSRKFASPVNLTAYGELRMYLYKPVSESLPAQMRVVLALLSSENHRLEVELDPSLFTDGWNEIAVALSAPYRVTVNGEAAENLTGGDVLLVTKRVSEIRFGFQAEGADLADAFQVWLDEWHFAGSRGYWDKAWYTEGTLGYRGVLLSLSGFPVVEDPVLSLGYERREGYLHAQAANAPAVQEEAAADEAEAAGAGASPGAADDRSDRYSADLRSVLLGWLDTRLYLSREEVRPIRYREELPFGLDTGSLSTVQSHSLVLDLPSPYAPVLEHSFSRLVYDGGEVELTQTDYLHRDRATYDESLLFRERLDLPFGLSQSFSFTRSWLYDRSAVVYPEISAEADLEDKASLDQQVDLELGYSWRSNALSSYFTRNEEYTGDAVPRVARWLDSYTYKLGRLLSPPEENLDQASLFSRYDQAGIGASFPLVENAGFYGNLDTTYTELNFQRDHTVRDASYTHRLVLEAPFYLLGDRRMLVSPSLEREIAGTCEEASLSLGEDTVLTRTLPFLLMPPFYYISPFPGLGREKDYRAVDLFGSQEDVLGSSGNTLTNRYRLDLSLDYDPWFIPSSMGLSLYGETGRDGGTYRQARGGGASVGKTLPLAGREGWYQKELTLTLGYETGRDYARKLITHGATLETGVAGLRSRHRGFMIDSRVGIESRSQHIGDPRLYLFPGDPSAEITVAPVPDAVVLDHLLLFQYLWELPLGARLSGEGAGTGAGAGPSAGEQGSPLRNTELVKIENQVTFTDRERAASFSNIPLRVTLEHLTDYRMKDLVTFGFRFMTVVGIEEKVFPQSTSGNLIPSMGMEFGVSLKVIF